MTNQKIKQDCIESAQRLTNQASQTLTQAKRLYGKGDYSQALKQAKLASIQSGKAWSGLVAVSRECPQDESIWKFADAVAKQRNVISRQVAMIKCACEGR